MLEKHSNVLPFPSERSFIRETNRKQALLRVRFYFPNCSSFFI
jgi:hypothetical protein